MEQFDPANPSHLGMQEGPPQSPEELEARKQGWDNFLTKFSSMMGKPEVNAMLVRMGAELARPLNPGQHQHSNLANAVVAGRGAATAENERLFGQGQAQQRTDIAADRNVIAREGEAGRTARHAAGLDLQREEMSLRDILSQRTQEGADRRQERSLRQQSSENAAQRALTASEGAANRVNRAGIAGMSAVMRGRDLDQSLALAMERLDLDERKLQQAEQQFDRVSRQSGNKDRIEAAKLLLSYKQGQEAAKSAADKEERETRLEILKGLQEQAMEQIALGEPAPSPLEMVATMEAMYEQGVLGLEGDTQPYGQLGRALEADVVEQAVTKAKAAGRTWEHFRGAYGDSVGPENLRRLQAEWDKSGPEADEVVPLSRQQFQRRKLAREEGQAILTSEEGAVKRLEQSVQSLMKPSTAGPSRPGPEGAARKAEVPEEKIDEAWGKAADIIDKYGLESEYGKRAAQVIKRLEKLVE